ncbi:MAG: aldehyde dehydrogenase (NADP(+)) [Verrucomicrobiota bacterium]
MPSFHGHSLIDGGRSRGSATSFQALSPMGLQPLPGEFFLATDAEVDAALAAARRDFAACRNCPGAARADLLETIANNLLALGDVLVERIHLECGLSEARIHSERARTVNQLRIFAAMARDHTWLDSRIETALPDRQPGPKPDLRRLLVPIGPVVVFGSSNFPLAYSVVGGDTASALATGNPVIVKAHAAHPGTSELVAEAVLAALRSLGLSAGFFAMLHGCGETIGISLVKHPDTRAVGFTGSFAGGRALFDAAASRPDPIPVFAEMSGLNPIVLLPGAVRVRPTEIATIIAQSITQGVGQFCTKPGLILLSEGPGADAFRNALASAITAVAPAPMLHAGIAGSYQDGCRHASSHPALRVLARAAATSDACEGAALVVATDAAGLLADASLRHEVFGPFSMVVSITAPEQIDAVLHSLGGQLTASVFAEPDELAPELLDSLVQIAGRVIVNGVPTGVEVCTASNHGGPWPATTDSRFTAVGPTAYLRFVRPVAYQNTPDHLLPPVLQNANPLGIPRLLNGVLSSAAVTPVG